MKDDDLKGEGYKYLGWMNGWTSTPPEYTKCQKLGHIMHDISYSNRGSHHTKHCEICKIYCNYDSSD
jgi:hypothetical protein